jgi:predicted ATP-dependent Lon-type protease
VGTRGPDLGSGATLFQLTNLACNVDAKYFVRAYNSAGESQDSNHDSAVTVPCGATNLVPAGLAKTMVIFIFVDQSTNETGFHLYEDDNLVATLSARSGSGVQTSDNHNQGCGQTHVYSLKAFNSAGESKSSEHVGLTTLPCFP